MARSATSRLAPPVSPRFARSPQAYVAPPGRRRTSVLDGHTHSADRGPSGNQFHVGVDTFDYFPVPSERWIGGWRHLL